MDKPIKDWTLTELKEYCKGKFSCGGCVIGARNGRCPARDMPGEWSFLSPFTASEVEKTEAVKVLCPEAVTLHRLNTIIQVEDAGDRVLLEVEATLFPSLGVNGTVSIEGIIGGAE